MKFWTYKWLVLALMLSLGLSVTIIACDDDDDDDDTYEDDDDTYDDDTSDDDTSDDDDDDVPATCDEVYSLMYDDCGWAFLDQDANEIPKGDVIGWCEDGDPDYGLDGPFADCIITFYYDCDLMLDCLNEVLGG
jgi:hypothetical protein